MFTLVSVGLTSPCTVAQDPGNSSQEFERLKRERDALTASVREADTRLEELSSQFSRLNKSEDRVESIATILELSKWLGRLSMGPIGLGLEFGGYFFGAVALLYVVIARREAAGRWLGIKYPFQSPLKRSRAEAAPLGPRARTVWVVLAVLALLFMAVPAFSQDSVESDLNRALNLINLTPLLRTILILETTRDGQSVTVEISPEISDAIRQSASEHGHAPLFNPSGSGAARLSLHRPDSDWLIVMFSLYEAAGNDRASATLEHLANVYLDSSRSMDFENMMRFARTLRAHDKTDLMERWVRRGFRRVDRLDELSAWVNFARDVDLQTVAIESIMTSLSESRRSADQLIGIAKILAEMGATTESETVFAGLMASGDFGVYLSVVRAASDLGMEELTDRALGDAVAKAGALQDLESLLRVANQLNRMGLVANRFNAVFASNANLATWQAPNLASPGFGAELVESERISLASLVGTYVFNAQAPTESRELFEFPVTQGLDRIISSKGAEPETNLNDLYVLAKYYELSNVALPQSLDRMIVFQRALRGLDAVEVDHELEAAVLAVRVDIERLERDLSQKKSTIADYENMNNDLSRRIAAGRWQILALVARRLGQSFLLVVGIWIAFSRALQAGRRTSEYRASAFCWTFSETIGIEFCCTLVLLPIGLSLVLFSQLILKVFQIIDKESVRPRADARKPAQGTA